MRLTRFLIAMVAAASFAATAAFAAPPLRVCADPNNLPFSNARGEGFENKIARLLARDLGTTVAMAVRRGDTALRDRLDAVILKREKEIDAILREYGVPRV